MGEELISIYKNRVKKSWKIAFYSVVIIGLLVHLYKFTNYLPNRDSLHNIYHDQNIVGSGRWFLSIACGISSYFDLPLVNGILSILYIAVSMVLITDLFRMENPVLIILSAGVLVTFPGVTETFFYEYTADGYFLAMLLAASAAWLTRINNMISIRKYFVGAILICLSCAIYQSYVSFALSLALFHLLYELLDGEQNLAKIKKWLLSQVAMYLAAMVLYYVIWKVCLWAQQAEVNKYQGIANIGSDFVKVFLSGFGRSIRGVVFFFVQWDIYERGLTVFSGLNIVFMVFCFSIIMIAVVYSNLYQRKAPLILYCVGVLLFVPVCCIWTFVSNGVVYRPMMLFSIALLYIFALRLFERWAVPRWSNIMAMLMAAIIFNFSIMSNIGYHYLFQCYEQTYATAIHMMMEISELRHENDFDRIAVIGNDFYTNRLETYDYMEHRQTEAAGIDVFAEYIYYDLMYEHVRTTTMLNRYLPVNLEPVSKEELKVYEKMAAVLEMPMWPEEGSVQVIGDTVVIRLSDVYLD